MRDARNVPAEPAGIRCMVMRGGTSKGAYFVAADLPADPAERDQLVLRIVGSPDPRQIDGIGGANPLTTKVAVIGASGHERADVDYLFLQPSVTEPRVSLDQNCGNLLAGVAQFAIERGLIGMPPGDATSASARILMVNTDSVATATFPVADGRPVYAGETAISGVPGTAAAVRLDFEQIAGSSCGALLPTGSPTDVIDGVTVTLIDNGMPVVVLAAADVGVTGYESPDEIEGNAELRAALESIRLKAGPLMNLGDVATTTVPKLTLVAPPRQGGALCTRTLIPHRVHEAIGVLGAVSVATAALFPESPAHAVLDPAVAEAAAAGGDVVMAIEHPTGTFDAALTVVHGEHGPQVAQAGIIRTARKLFDGTVFPRPAP
jgi:4-oxalomesaconate tautomerase